MRKASVIIAIFSLLYLFPIGGLAADLKFPETEKEIVEYLSLKDGRTIYKGVEYESRNGRVYKIIGGKRFQMKSLAVISRSELTPRVGAIITFEFDQTKIDPQAYPLLDEFGKALKGELIKAIIQIEGHTDLIGGRAYNLKLSEARAKAIKNYLISRHKIDPRRLRAFGYGESRPLEKTADRSKLNRRVEFVRIGGF
ncbi:MAG: OmpA family protein [Syntrophobacterales bacterium]|jgi:outer membrane protein OmpA-like peptidoglycan-associated protein